VNWLRRTFLYRDDYIPALQGLRGVAALWFFHWSFYAQFDPAKLSRITEGKPWLATGLDALRLALAPGELTPVVAGIICGFLLAWKQSGRDAPLRNMWSAFARIYGLYLVAILPAVSYSGQDWLAVGKILIFLDAPFGFPPFTTFLGVILAYKLLVFASSAADTLALDRHRTIVKAAFTVAELALLFGTNYPWGFTLALLVSRTGWHVLKDGGLKAKFAYPGLLLLAGAGVALLPLPLPVRAFLAMALLAHAPTDISRLTTPATRLLSHPLLRYFGAVALPFFLIHTTWGFRLSRSILQGELHSVQAIASHYALSLVFSAVFAGFLHIFFERPRFLQNLRNGPSAAIKPSSAIQGASS